VKPAIHILKGDLTQHHADAVVNAANNDLKLGGGLAGAIDRAGGPEIQADCDRHGPIEVGQAAITTGGNLPARYVIHQASMRLGGRTTEETLRDSTRAVLEIAEKQRDISTLAFPATGTGIAGFPDEDCAEIMLEEVKRHIESGTNLKEIHFVLFDEQTRDVFLRACERIFDEPCRPGPQEPKE
jgi:O-acetyl-ADP-ribose deacetylase (regulator of RNase III)